MDDNVGEKCGIHVCFSEAYEKGRQQGRILKMNKLVSLASFALMASGAMLLSPAASATPSEHLNWGQNLAATETACPSGKPLVNVNQKVINDIDSAVGGGYWAYDEEVRHITIVALDATHYCATVSYQGSFESTGFKSPAGNAGALAAGVVGTYQGGYTATFTASGMVSGARTKGSLGTFDYQCVATTGACPGYVSWLSLFFTGVANFDQPWWGWVYHAGNNGSWVNATNGNSGDITGE